MNVDIIASGSRGNCAIIDNAIMIDAGVETLENAEVCLITHTHTDHTKKIPSVSGMRLYCLQETADILQEKYPYVTFNILQSERATVVTVRDYEYVITPIRLKHDVPCIGFDIERFVEASFDYEPPTRIFFATDFSQIEDDDRIVTFLKDKRYDAVYLECNNTLSFGDLSDVYTPDEDGKLPKDEFHRRRSFQNHCSADYLIGLFTRAGFDETNRFTEPVTLLHKSSYYYGANYDRIVELCKIANILNPLL